MILLSKIASLLTFSFDAVFKSRCRFFTPPFAEGARGERERSMWEGLATPEAQKAQR